MSSSLVKSIAQTSLFKGGVTCTAAPLSVTQYGFHGTHLRIKSVKGLGLGPIGLNSCRQRGLRIEAKAFEAAKPRDDDLLSYGTPDEILIAQEKEHSVAEVAHKVKIGLYFGTWWALNVVFNIYNKKVLNAFPYPWLISTLSLAAGSAMMLASWATTIVKPPQTDLDFWKALAPVAVAHTIGHVAASVSMSKVAVSFTHIIKSAEPAFSVMVSRFFLGEHFPLPVYMSLIPIIGGCALAAVTELNFNMIGFMGAMISNLAFVFRNIFSKRGMKGKAVGGMNYYACLSMLSLAILTPFAFAVEGTKVWAAGWDNALQTIGPHFVWQSSDDLMKGRERLYLRIKIKRISSPFHDAWKGCQRGFLKSVDMPPYSRQYFLATLRSRSRSRNISIMTCTLLLCNTI